jgi:protease IV
MRDFFKIATASAVGTLVGLFSLLLLLGLGAFGLVGVLLSSGDNEQETALGEQSLLVLDLDMTDIVDGLPTASGALFDVYGQQRSVSLYGTLEAIAQAAEDDKISGIFIKGNTDEGFATLKEVRTALSAFKASGKPIWAYTTGLDEQSYYLDSVADNLVLAPVGNMEINGFRAETQFLANALQKYGVGVQVLRVGRYKSAIEPFTRTQSSPEDKQQTEALIGDLWKDFLTTVASDRDITTEQLQKLANEVAIIEPQQALDAGLVDRLGFYNDVLTELKTLTDTSQDEAEEDIPQMDLADYAQMVANRPDDAADTVAVVYAEGNIIVGEDVVPGSITSEGLATALREVRHDKNIKAAVLRVNSPGGSAIASEVIADEVKRLAKAKPLVVSMGDYAASGGYMIAAPGAKILASPTTITGSIGVYGLLLNFQEIANKNGITWDVVKTAKFADMQTNARPQTEAELKIQQGYVDNLYDRFITIVSDGRKISKERVSQVAQGRVWTGEDAIAANLVDEMGGLNDAIALAAKTANLETYAVNEYPQLPSIEEQLLESLFGMGMTTELASRLPWNKDPLTDQLLKLREEFTLLESLNDPNGTYMRLPFTTEID